MKTTVTILSLSLLLCSMAMAQSTRPIDNPYGLTVFGYAKEFTPDHFAVTEDGTVYVVSAEGDSFRLYPRPRLGEVNGTIETMELTKAQKEGANRKSVILEQASDRLVNSGFNDFITFLESSKGVVEVRIVASNCVQIIFEDGDFEEVTIGPSEVRSGDIQPRISPQEYWMKKFQDALNAGSTVWFGTSTFVQGKYSPEQLQIYRNGIAALRQGKALSPEECLTPASHEGVIVDALR